MNNDLTKIDGSTGEGGGQILRTAVSLAAANKRPCHVFNIRKGRPKPGLAAQHLLGIQALAQMCNGRIEGDFIGSKEITFYPGPIGIPSASYGASETKRKDFRVKIETAGSITLALQTLILPALFSQEPVSPVRNSENEEKVQKEQVSNGIKIIFNGGATDTFFSPTIDYFRYVFLKILEKIEIRIEINILKKGYYPEGEAEVEITIFPLLRQGFGGQASKLKPLNLTGRGKLKKITAISGASESLKGKKVAERQMAGVREVLGKLKLPIEDRIEYYETSCPGSQICLIAEFENTVIGTDNLGKLGKRAEDIGKEAALELLKEQKTGACLDKHMADQILPYMALVQKKSQISVSEITNHCKTNIWAIEKFINGNFKIENNLITWTPK